MIRARTLASEGPDTGEMRSGANGDRPRRARMSVDEATAAATLDAIAKCAAGTGGTREAVVVRLLGVLLAACVPPPAAAPSASSAPIVIHGGDSSELHYTGGTYRVSWDAGGCTRWKLAIGDITIPVTDATGSAVVVLPARTASVNSSAACPRGANWTLTAQPQ